MTNINIITGPMRMPFLVLAPACVFLGLGSAIWSTGSYNTVYSLLALLGALAAHISVNSLNEYFDFKSGLDMKTTRTPFSGGSGTLPANPEKFKVAWVIGVVSLAVAALIGIYFLSVWGFGTAAFGLDWPVRCLFLYHLADPLAAAVPGRPWIRLWYIDGYGDPFCTHRLL
jgi:1,4-dihydroxy-2-naphthoate polyprenyltransferase